MVHSGKYGLLELNFLCSSAIVLVLIPDLDERKKERLPEFTSVLDDVVGVDRTETKLTCRLAGYPTPEIKWMCNGVKVFMDDNYMAKFDGTEATLIIHNTQMEDAGRYTCQVCVVIKLIGSATAPCAILRGHTAS